MKTFQMTVADIANVVFDGEAQSLSCVGASGNMVVLPGHMPLVTTIKPCDVRVVDAKGEEHTFPTISGILEVTQTRATLLL